MYLFKGKSLRCEVFFCFFLCPSLAVHVDNIPYDRKDNKIRYCDQMKIKPFGTIAFSAFACA